LVIIPYVVREERLGEYKGESNENLKFLLGTLLNIYGIQKNHGQYGVLIHD
jgi:hypothetical protein